MVDHDSVFLSFSPLNVVDAPASYHMFFVLWWPHNLLIKPMDGAEIEYVGNAPTDDDQTLCFGVLDRRGKSGSTAREERRRNNMVIVHSYTLTLISFFTSSNLSLWVMFNRRGVDLKVCILCSHCWKDTIFNGANSKHCLLFPFYFLLLP